MIPTRQFKHRPSLSYIYQQHTTSKLPQLYFGLYALTPSHLTFSRDAFSILQHNKIQHLNPTLTHRSKLLLFHLSLPILEAPAYIAISIAHRSSLKPPNAQTPRSHSLNAIYIQPRHLPILHRPRNTCSTSQNVDYSSTHDYIIYLSSPIF